MKTDMTIGLKRGTVALVENNSALMQEAEKTILLLHNLLGKAAVDIQHIGSTSIKGIYTKPIIDIVVGVNRFDDILQLNYSLEKNGIIFRGADVQGQLLYVMGDFEKDTRTHHIHIVIYNDESWNNYINFRDYLNYNKDLANEYSKLKYELTLKYQNDRIGYTSGKREFIDKALSAAKLWRKNQTI